MLRLSFSTLGCPDWSWHDVLRNGSKFRYDGVEIRLLSREPDLLRVPELQPGALATRRRELAEAGFQVCGLSSSARFDEPEEGQRRARFDNACRYIELAHELRASFVRVFGDVYPTGADERRKEALRETIAENLNRLGEIAASAGVEIIIETHGDFADSTHMEQLMRLVTSPAVGVLWDTHHPWRFYDEDLTATYRRLRPWVRHTHWKDSISRPEQSLSGDARAAASLAHSLMSGHKPADYVLFGGGEFPIPECLKLLLDDGYSRWCSYEWEKMWHPHLEEPEIALRLFPQKMRMFETCREAGRPRSEDR